MLRFLVIASSINLPLSLDAARSLSLGRDLDAAPISARGKITYEVIDPPNSLSG